MLWSWSREMRKMAIMAGVGGKRKRRDRAAGGVGAAEWQWLQSIFLIGVGGSWKVSSFSLSRKYLFVRLCMSWCWAAAYSWEGNWPAYFWESHRNESTWFVVTANISGVQLHPPLSWSLGSSPDSRPPADMLLWQSGEEWPWQLDVFRVRVSSSRSCPLLCVHLLSSEVQDLCMGTGETANGPKLRGQARILERPWECFWLQGRGIWRQCVAWIGSWVRENGSKGHS